MWPLSYLGFPTSIIGLALGVPGLKRRRRGIAVTGSLMCGMGLILTTVDLAIGLLDLILKTYFLY
ncbi:hypothetical protein ACFLUD_01090 [Chloroflexota bacterium]